MKPDLTQGRSGSWDEETRIYLIPTESGLVISGFEKLTAER